MLQQLFCGQVEDLDHIFLECPINRDPSNYLYQSLIAEGLLASFRFRGELANITPNIDRVFNTFMHKNNIKLYKCMGTRRIDCRVDG